MDDKNSILKGLEPLFKAARERNLWFYSSYQKLWFSPDELQKEQSEERFVWGAVNWELRNPYERLNEYCAQIANIEKSKAAFNERIKASGL